MRDQALAENTHLGVASTSATDAQVPGMLKLQDPRPEIITRSWRYFAGLSAQTFQSSGQADKEGLSTFDLGKNSSTVMPGFEFGVLSKKIALQDFNWSFGVRGKAQFASQSTDVKLSSGYTIDDARLNTTVLAAGPLFLVQWTGLPWLSATLSPQFGTVNYTQTGASDFASFSKSATFDALGLGLDVAISPTWSLFTEWTQKNLQNDNEIALQKDNFEIGTKIVW
ncbi:MAG: hypothetical protein HUU57_07070 [Bdellovibrio sp.]|nr:hypothetical protein [Bdellovibrio sp.]